MERSDAELLEASRRGERAAFATLVERYQGVVCAVSYSRTGDRAMSEDVAQDTFLAAWRQLHQVREVERLRAWLCGIARNLSAKARRRHSREAPAELELEAAEHADLFEEVSDRQAERVVRDALDRVPETYREVLVLYYHEHRSAREVAQTLGISEAAVLQRLARGRQALAQGVTGLVERALRSPLPRRSLVVGVLAALPALAPSHAAAATSTHGGISMLKIALISAALTAAGAAAYVTTTSSATKGPGAAAAAPAAHQPALAQAAPARPAPSPAAAITPAPAAAPASEDCADCKERRRVVDPPAVDEQTIKRVGLHEGPSRGPADAPVVIAMFTDLQCKYCGVALGTIDQIFEEYEGKVRIVVKQFPVHKTAVLPAQAALAADAQGKFWDLYDLMMANQDALDLEGLVELAKRADLDVAAFRRDLERETFKGAVDKNLEVGKELGIQGTPAFFINGQPVTGARPPEEMRALVDAALAKR